jgi:hypothetical protein
LLESPLGGQSHGEEWLGDGWVAQVGGRACSSWVSDATAVGDGSHDGQLGSGRSADSVAGGDCEEGGGVGEGEAVEVVSLSSDSDGPGSGMRMGGDSVGSMKLLDTELWTLAWTERWGNGALTCS